RWSNLPEAGLTPHAPPRRTGPRRQGPAALMAAAALLIAIVLQTPAPASSPPTLTDAQRLFYNAHYEQAANLALTLRESGGQDLANDEMRTTALLFQLRG